MTAVASDSRDRIRETTTTTGTGNITLAGAATGYTAFSPTYATDERFWYCIAAQTGTEWEVGQGYLSGSTTLVRELVVASTNAGAAVNFSAGTKDVFVTFPAYLAGRTTPRGLSLMMANLAWMP
jgi:hypothetical protein